MSYLSHCLIEITKKYYAVYKEYLHSTIKSKSKIINNYFDKVKLFEKLIDDFLISGDLGEIFESEFVRNERTFDKTLIDIFDIEE